MKQFYKYFKNVQHVGCYECHLEKVPQQLMVLNQSVALLIKKLHVNAVKECYKKIHNLAIILRIL